VKPGKVQGQKSIHFIRGIEGKKKGEKGGGPKIFQVTWGGRISGEGKVTEGLEEEMTYEWGGVGIVGSLFETKDHLLVREQVNQGKTAFYIHGGEIVKEKLT